MSVNEESISSTKPEGEDGPSRPSTAIDSDSDSETSRNVHSTSIEPSILPGEQVKATMAHVQGNSTENQLIVSGGEVVAHIWKPISLILMVYLILIALPHTVVEAFPETPCNFPGLSKYFPQCPRKLSLPREEKPVVTPDFITLAQLQSRLEYIMEDSTSVSIVSVDIKESEMALRDLGIVVRHSAISSREVLEHNIKLFVGEAKATSGDLQRFGSRVWGVVDRIVSLNQHVALMLEGIVSDKIPEEPGRSLEDVAISLMSTRWGWITGAHQKGIEDLWLQALNIMEAALRKLIHEAQANVGSLQRLKERLDNIQDLVSVERHDIDAAERKLKKKWLKQFLGLNDDKLREYSASLGLLHRVQDDRNRALKQVAAVLFKLEQMSRDLEDLREGVATPLLVETPGSFSIPIEAHIKSIRGETERLIKGQARMREIEDEYRRKKFSH